MTVAIARPGLEQTIQGVIEDSLSALGLRLVRIRYQFHATPPGRASDRKRLKPTKPRPAGTLQVMIEPDDGGNLPIDECGKAHRHISTLLDVADPIDQAFQLEVSSVGMTRPLTRNSDFRNFVGQRIEATLEQMIDNRRRFKGILQAGEGDDQIVVTVEDGTSHTLDLDNVAEARLLSEQGQTSHPPLRRKSC